MDEIVLTPENRERMTLALEECRNRIVAAFKRGLDAYKMLSRELLKIESESLYLVYDATFEDWIRKNLGMERRDIKRIHAIGSTVVLLERQALQLPYNESQILELARLAPELQPTVWRKLLRINEVKDIPITSEIIRKAVDREIKIAATKSTPASEGVNPTLDFDAAVQPAGTAQPTIPAAKSTQAPAALSRITLTAKGEHALARIRSLCGSSVADALENGSVPISERDIIRWGEEEDRELVRNLAYYVTDLRWNLSKALAYERTLIDSETTVASLVTLARARSGRFATSHDDAKIVVELTSHDLSR